MTDAPCIDPKLAEHYLETWPVVCGPAFRRHQDQQRRKAMPADSLSGPWLIIQANPNREYVALRSLRDLAFEAFVPEIVREVRVGRDARKPNACRKFPVAGGLVLARHANPQAWTGLQHTDGVRGVVMAGDRPALARDDGPKGIAAWREKLRPQVVPVVDAAYRIGQRFVITDGALLGFEAVVSDLPGNDVPEFTVHVFGRSTRLQIGREQLEAVA